MAKAKKENEEKEESASETKRIVPKTVEVKEEEEKEKEESKNEKKEPVEKKEETLDKNEHSRSFQNLSGPQENKSKFPWLIFVLTLIFAIAGGLGGFLAYQKGIEKGKLLVESPSPIATSTPAPTASSAADLKRSDLSLEVLNGTGESGLASEAKTFLEDKGYSVDNIDNAKVFGATETQISIKDSKKGYIDLLKSDLSEKYPVASDSTGLSADSQYDAVITIGH